MNSSHHPHVRILYTFGRVPTKKARKHSAFEPRHVSLLGSFPLARPLINGTMGNPPSP